MKLALACLLCALSVPVCAAPPLQKSVETVLGPKAYRDGDVIEITDVTATSPKLEQGDTVTVRGRYRLDSHEAADLCLFLTQTEGDGLEETDATQTMRVERGHGKFELKTTIKHRGWLHVTFYDVETGKPFGGVYFGTPKQMEEMGESDVSHYLSPDEPHDDAANRFW